MMRYFKGLHLLFCIAIAIPASSAVKFKDYPDYLQPDKAINSVSMVMVHDVVSPPAAGRYYAYCMLSAYYIVAANDKQQPELEKFIKDFKNTSVFDTIHFKYDYRIAAYFSILETAKLMLPSGFMMEDDEDAFVKILQNSKVDPTIITHSITVAKIASGLIISFSKADNYNKLSALKRYTPLKEDGKWYPTPPAYMEAVEPNWKTIRPMVIDSSNQFKPVSPIPFSIDTNAAFYKQAVDVYIKSKHLSGTETEIASFWDCNPFAITTSGHMSIGFKKISPGGHWMHITGLAVTKAHLNFNQSILVLTMEGVTLMDAFISTWDEKYSSNRIRPETYINKYIDIKWQPFLQTPPFPEYTSGHAVVSNASATMLTYLLGDNFAYTDNTEIPFGSGERSFKSFKQAAQEASISRFYGGIHFMDSITNGNMQGVLVAENIINKIKKVGILQQFK